MTSVETPPPANNPTPTASAAPHGGGAMGWFRGLKTWKKIGLGLVAFIIIVVALANWATSGLGKVVDHHFAAAKSGDTVAAYSDFSVAARQETTMEAFTTMLQNMPSLTQVTGSSWDKREVNNGQGHLEGMLELQGGGKLPIEVRLVKENDQWKILSYHVKPAASQ